MTLKRRSELQRKLSLNAVPRPPADLAERIKADIPKYLEADPERSRFSRSIAFNMRIAASILLLVTALATTVYLVSPQTEEVMTASPGAAVFAPADRAMPRRLPSAPTQEVQLEIAQDPIPELTAQELAAPQLTGAIPMSPRTQSSARGERQNARPFREGEAREERVREEEGRLAESDKTFASDLASGGAANVPDEPQQVAAAAPASTAPERSRNTAAMRKSAPAPPAATPQASRDAVRETITVTANVPMSIVTEAHASKMTHDAAGEIFGISVDPAAFQRIRSRLERGDRPAASSVDVEALVNYFAATAGSAPRRGVRLEVEASPAAIEAAGDHAILRFTVDASRGDGLKGGSIPPLAADARIEVEFNDEVVNHATRIGGNEPFGPQAAILAGTSVTALYDLELHPDLRSKQTVATVRLHYKSIPEGKDVTITRIVKASDLAKNWSRATRRHRLASLGALWAGTLKGTAGGSAVARRAEELATQKPDDLLARALAAAASASAGGR